MTLLLSPAVIRPPSPVPAPGSKIPKLFGFHRQQDVTVTLLSGIVRQHWYTGVLSHMEMLNMRAVCRLSHRLLTPSTFSVLNLSDGPGSGLLRLSMLERVGCYIISFIKNVVISCGQRKTCQSFAMDSPQVITQMLRILSTFPGLCGVHLVGTYSGTSLPVSFTGDNPTNMSSVVDAVLRMPRSFRFDISITEDPSSSDIVSLYSSQQYALGVQYTFPRSLSLPPSATHTADRLTFIHLAQVVLTNANHVVLQQLNSVRRVGLFDVLIDFTAGERLGALTWSTLWGKGEQTWPALEYLFTQGCGYGVQCGKTYLRTNCLGTYRLLEDQDALRSLNDALHQRGCRKKEKELSRLLGMEAPALTKRELKLLQAGST